MDGLFQIQRIRSDAFYIEGCFLDRKPLPNLRTPTMPPISSNIEAISTVPDEKLNSISQLDLSTLRRALSREPTYIAYKSLLTYRRTLHSLNANVDLRVEHADDALNKTSEDLGNTATALVNVCTSPGQTTIGQALRATMKLQMLYQRENVNVLVNCRREQMRAQIYQEAVDRRVEEVEWALVEKYGVDDEGKPLLNEHDVERMTGIEDL